MAETVTFSTVTVVTRMVTVTISVTAEDGGGGERRRRTDGGGRGSLMADQRDLPDSVVATMMMAEREMVTITSAV